MKRPILYTFAAFLALGIIATGNIHIIVMAIFAVIALNMIEGFLKRA